MLSELIILASFVRMMLSVFLFYPLATKISC